MSKNTVNQKFVLSIVCKVTFDFKDFRLLTQNIIIMKYKSGG
jgi:predicted cupin superfamily sugar epimerase